MTAKGQVKSKEEDQKVMSREDSQLSWWIIVWFYATAVICTWDATFIMLRPYSLPGGSLGGIWYLYKYYVTVDQRYQDTGDAYVFAQSLMNYVEVVINFVAIYMHYHCSKHTVMTAFTVSVMTFWKTVLYLLMYTDFCTGSVYRQGNSAVEEFFLVFIPNVIWIIVPAAVMVVLWEQLLPQSDAKVMTLNKNGFVNYEKNGFVNGHANEHVNGYGNGHLNGHNNGHFNGHIKAENGLVNRKMARSY